MALKKKWKQLRDTFRAELRKCPPDRSGDAGPHSVNEMCSQWSHFESMMFIKDQIKCRQSSGNLCRQKNNQVQDMNINIGEDVNSVDIEASQCEEESDMSTFEVQTSTPHHPPRNLKRRHNNIEGEMLNIEKKKLELLEQKTKNKITADDEDMAFFVSLLPHVKKMDPQTKLLCRMEMQKSVYHHAYNVGRSFNLQNIQNQDSYISVPSPTLLESSSNQYSDNAVSSQEPSTFVTSGNIITFSN